MENLVSDLLALASLGRALSTFGDVSSSEMVEQVATKVIASRACATKILTLDPFKFA